MSKGIKVTKRLLQVLDWISKCSGMGMPFGNDSIYTLLFADDKVVISQDYEDMEYMLRKLLEEYE